MNTQLIRLDKAKDLTEWKIIEELVTKAKLPNLTYRMNELEYKQQENGGACRCLFWESKSGKTEFGFSDREDKVHAEENCFKKLQEAGFQLDGSRWIMYVDLEPCHSGRYKGHNCRAFFTPGSNNINLSVDYSVNGYVLYAFDQADKGEKTQAAEMHNKRQTADNMVIGMLGLDFFKYQKEVNGIEFFKPGDVPKR